MKVLIQLWRILSFPMILGGLALVWYGVHNWPLTSTGPVVSASELFAKHPDVTLIRDSLRFDLRRASIRQDNYFGIKSKAFAVFPAWAGKDSGATRLVILSSRPGFLGPAVKSFQRIDSADGAIRVQSSDLTSTGLLLPKFDAMIQSLAADLDVHLKDSAQGRAWLEGTAIRRTELTGIGIDSVASEYYEIRLDGVPTRSKVLSWLAMGLAAIGIGIGLSVYTKRWDARQAEAEEEERNNEQPLV